ncbi:MAG TPA: type III-B CRISPR module-associated protein Cmr5 [Bacillota bacterium]|nr:type III-B CRISPR module-associated protein Cmr5 [Bacillota bacterium]HOK64819.1 type III-B CRISPR module-associated protein Cmr5 [Bacillota bacterium]HOL12470.1 type III-B CRISPR module-associated protein Cmr5 [Bacillota bacterium]HOQ03406.1 type III-B CRISPR module-associated protein Cmr5 [Bacillota bacterium]HPP61217.1 type III-B CRISPR module-associated protein Cmr5 [Bacillota bacterium]
MLTKDQQYASLAFDQVNKMRNESKDDQTKYGSMAHRLPVLIRKAGLAQAIGFVESRGTSAQQELLNHISEAVGVEDIAEYSRKAELAEYMKLTNDVMAALVWYKRFAVSVLKVESGMDEDAGGETQ